MQGIVFPGKRALLSLSIVSAFIFTANAEVSSVMEFDPAFLMLSEGTVLDLERFSRGASATPGTHRIRLFFNNQLHLHQDITFITQTDKNVAPCLTSSLLMQLPLKRSMLAENVLLEGTDSCIDVGAMIPGSTIVFDSAEQALRIDVPQIYESRTARDSVPQSLWDSGIPAGLLGYSFNAYNSESRGQSFNHLYTGVNSGINLGAWYFRHNGAWSWDNQAGGHYQTINTYVQRDLPIIKGRLSMGQVNTSGQLFDTLPFTGLKVESDERMEPLSRRGYAPEIRGIASTNARVTVNQNDKLIYDTTVSPGAFVIDDLYPTGYGGDLDVTVHEADGSEQFFKVPYASVTPLLRSGVSRYEFSVGELNSRYLQDDPSLWQGAWQYGVNNWLTVYGGVQGSEHYKAGQGGAAVAAPFGAISADITHARTELNDTSKSKNGEGNRRGESYRISYSKNITETRSHFALAAYRFSTHGYMDYLTTMQTRDSLSKGYDANTIRRNKSRYSLTATQGLPGNWGQFYLSSSIQNYWNSNDTDKQYQFGYSNHWNRVNYSINAGRSWSAYGRAQDTVSLNLSFPLGSTQRSPLGHFSYNSSNGGSENWRMGLSGSAGEEHQFSYGMSATAGNQGVGTSGAVNAQYISPWTSVNAAYSSGRHYSSVSGGLSGTMIGHSRGVTLSPYQGETFALIEAKGAEGAKVSGYSNTRIDSRGYAAVPYLSPYQLNDVRVDLKGSAMGVELDNTSQKVVPYEGAVVKVRYQTRQGRPVLITVLNLETPLPFGAEVHNEAGDVVGYVGQGGQIYARVEKDSGILTTNYNNHSEPMCQLNYQLPHKDQGKNTSLELMTASCFQN